MRGRIAEDSESLHPGISRLALTGAGPAEAHADHVPVQQRREQGVTTPTSVIPNSARAPRATWSPVGWGGNWGRGNVHHIGSGAAGATSLPPAISPVRISNAVNCATKRSA